MEFKLFYEITSVLVVAGLIAVLVSMLKQPSIIAYIITGLIIGPFGYYQIRHNGVLDSLGVIGITLLLFMVGLELDLKRIKQLGKVSLYTGIGQIIFTAVIGFFICRLLDFSNTASLYIATALTFSSTIVAVKLLGEKKDLQSLYGRIVVGFLIVQDFVALGILLVLGNSHSGGSDLFRALPTWQYLLTLLVKVLIIVLLLVWLSKKVFPRFLDHLGKSDELLLVFALAWALGLASLMSLPFVGFSLETGGFLAGLALANSHVHYEIGARIKSLRDFFIIIFFIVFGAQLVFDGIGQLILPAVVLSLFVLIAKPLILMVIMGWLGYKPRTSFSASATIAQISEFSFVLVALGSRLGHVSNDVLGLVALVGIITIAGSSYMILFAGKLYNWFYPALKVFDFRDGSAERSIQEEILKKHIVLVGANRLGAHLVDVLKNLKHPFVIVDFDPTVSKIHIDGGLNVICGDITDPSIQEQINLPEARLIISTIPDFKDNLALLEAVKKSADSFQKIPKLIFAAQNEAEAKHFYENEIDYVISPHFISSLHLAKILEEGLRYNNLRKLRESHLRIMQS